MSSVVEVSYKTSAAVPNSKIAVETRNLILERLPLFLHEHTHSKTKFTLAWLTSPEHFVVQMFGKLSITKKLRFGDAPTRSLDALAYAVYENNRIVLFLAGNAQVDMYYEYEDQALDPRQSLTVFKGRDFLESVTFRVTEG